jgi:hypothetical protein
MIIDFIMFSSATNLHVKFKPKKKLLFAQFLK